MRRDGSPVLLDFGSARQSFGSAKTLTILVAPGYAPLEQYYGDASTQGPWTDIYGLGATCYRAIAGRVPLGAVARAKGVLGSVREVLAPAAEVGRGRYGEAFLAAVDRSLQLSEKDRPQTIADWRRDLVADASPVLPSTDVPASAATTLPLAQPTIVETTRPRRAAAGLIAAVLVGVAGVWTFARTDRSTTIAAPAAASSSAPTIASPRVEPAAAVPVIASPVLAAASAPPTPVEPAKATEAQTTSRPTQIAVKATNLAPVVSTSPVPAIVRPTTSGADAPAPAPVATTAPPSTSVAAPIPQPAPRETTAARSPRDEAIDAAEATLRRGDPATAAQMLAPLAAAGASRAQALLGRAQEARPSGQQNDFEAYVWYGIAARNGQADAQSQRERVGAKLQPAEIRQADQIIERWKPRVEPASLTTNERTAP